MAGNNNRDIKLGRAGETFDFSRIPVPLCDTNSKACLSGGSEDKCGLRDGQVVFYDQDATHVNSPALCPESEDFDLDRGGRGGVTRSFSDENDHVVFDGLSASMPDDGKSGSNRPARIARASGLNLKDFFSAPRSNDERKRMHKEARTHRFSAGGSNKGNMKPEVPPLKLPPNGEVGFSSEQDSPRLSIVEPREVVLPTSESDLVEQRWGVYGDPNDGLFQRIRREVLGYVKDTVQSTILQPVIERAPALVLALSGGLTVASTRDRLEPYLGKWGTRIFGAVVTGAIAASAWVTDSCDAPELAGAGSPVAQTHATRTHHSHVDAMQYNAWQTGLVYRTMSDELIKQFVGCKVDEHVVRRAMKRASELQNLYSTPLDRGRVADTVSFSLCVVNVEMARASVSTRVSSFNPSSLGWN